MDKIAELRLDIAELEGLSKQATRQKVKDLLSIEARKVATEIVKLEEQAKQNVKTTDSTTVVAAAPTLEAASRCYQVKLKNYAWDQNNKHIKFYVNLKNVQNLPAENINCIFTTKSFELHVNGLDGKDYLLTINNLLSPVNPEGSSWKIKTDMVIVTVIKAECGHWSHVTELEKRASDAKKTPEMDKNADPSDGLMSIMKNMYDQGDDEMKRTIAKAWTESQNKKMEP